ncbi:MAG: thioredoxin family protein [Firmicutes bacterium]|mgnify:CR=1 FL=1|nr:thioredoxin family protein [Bacillota bacterium]
MNIKVLGSGCAKCNQLEELVREVVKDEGLDAAIEKVTDVAKIIGYGVMSTPALVVDEKVVCSGTLPSKGKLKELLMQ